MDYGKLRVHAAVRRHTVYKQQARYSADASQMNHERIEKKLVRRMDRPVDCRHRDDRHADLLLAYVAGSYRRLRARAVRAVAAGPGKGSLSRYCILQWPALA